MSPYGRQFHSSDPRILGARSLEHDFSRLAAILRPGMKVLDVGCGNGAITAGIARAIQPDGIAVGIDFDPELLKLAEQHRERCPNLRFEQHDLLASPFKQEFDVVATARCLQWIASLEVAITRLRDATKPGGIVIALDYDHTKHEWAPEPPPEFRTFFRAFLEWRMANSWDNRLAAILPECFRSAGLVDIQVHNADEVTDRGNSTLWPNVIETLGPVIVTAGFLSDEDWMAAIRVSVPWFSTELHRQSMVLRAVEGRVV